jgi:hypothetical protein
VKNGRRFTAPDVIVGKFKYEGVVNFECGRLVDYGTGGSVGGFYLWSWSAGDEGDGCNERNKRREIKGEK